MEHDKFPDHYKNHPQGLGGKTIFSGIQPTGNIHIGNYLGAIKSWVEMTQSPEASSSTYWFSIVDLHSITIFQNPSELAESTLAMLAIYIASGLKAEQENVTLFQQSSVPEHSELCWILSCHTPIGWLDRMTQYKDKSKENKERANLGLYSYPILMAADILLYNTNLVPVGEDQVQHVELTRDIATRVNNLYEKPIFAIPEYKLGRVRRVMSLQDGTRKMSKSDPSEKSRIHITDSDDEILSKISKSRTGDPSSPEVSNLLAIYNYLTSSKGQTPLTAEAINEKYADFKKNLANLLIEEISPIRSEYQKLLQDRMYLKSLIAAGNTRASTAARDKIKQIKIDTGLALHI